MLFATSIRRFTSLFGRRARLLTPRMGLAATLLVLLGGLAATAATATVFTAMLDGGHVRVEWEMSTEADVAGFDLYRKSAAEPGYALLTSIVPTGQRRYVYADRNGYRGSIGAGPASYRLLVRGDGGEQTYTTSLTPTPSAVQRSWDTIKSMFR
jgi:hypothetical protein